MRRYRFWRSGTSTSAYSAGFITDTSYIPVVISPPTLTRSSAAGTAPLQLGIAIDATVYAGYLAHLQIATDSGFTAITQDLTQIITADDVARLDMPFEGFITPSGLYYARVRIERDDGANSAYSNTVTDTISSIATFNPLRTSSATALSNGNLTNLATDVGDNAEKFSEGTSALSGATGYFEMTWTAIGTRNGPRVGVWDGSLVNLNTGTGFSGVPGVAFDYYDQLFVTGAVIAAITASFTVGSKIGFLVHKATRRVWFRNAAGWLDGTPVINIDGTVNASSTGGRYITGTNPIYIITEAQGADSMTLNAGQSAFSFTVPTNAIAQWS